MATLLVVEWEQTADAEEVWLEWDFEGQTYSSPRVARVAGYQHEVVLGLPAEVTVNVSVHVGESGDDNVIESGSGTTGSLPANLDAPTLELSDASRMRTEPYLLTAVDVGPQAFFGPCYTVILDREARIVWYRPTPGNRLTVVPKVALSGGFILLDETTVYVGGTPAVVRTTLDLEQTTITDVPGMFAVYDELEDGSLLFDERVSNYEFHLTRQYPDGSREDLWWCEPWMASYSSEFWACAPNTLEYDPVSGTVLWSMFQTSTVVEVDVLTAEVVNEFGQFPGGVLFDPPEANFDLQHQPNWSKDGTLMVSTHVPSRPGVQVAREFLFDEPLDTLREIWSYEADRYADYEGGVWKLDNGNYLWELGTAGVILEVTASGEEVWRMDWDGHMVGLTTPLDDLYALNAGF